MTQHIGSISLLVHDYDSAIAWFTEKLGFTLVSDTPLTPEKRWVLVAPPGGGTQLLLAKAAKPEQTARVGDQTGGRVFLFLHTNDFQRDYAAFKARSVTFLEEPRHEAYGTVAVFTDISGNKWDLVEFTAKPS